MKLHASPAFFDRLREMLPAAAKTHFHGIELVEDAALDDHVAEIRDEPGIECRRLTLHWPEREAP
jgi:hypothetical protein